MTFCLDTSALIEPWRRRYPLDVFPTFWETLDEWAETGRVVAPEEVLVEIRKVDDDLKAWLEDRRYLFLPPVEEVQVAVLEIMAGHPRLVDTKKGRSIADPWGIAQAEVSGAVVVTEEERAKGASPKIPDVCDFRKVEHTNVLGLIRAMGLRF